MVLGVLRLLLALAVVISHVPKAPFEWRMMGGVHAVQAFFIISGFYMAFILHEKYSTSYRLFITNRFLRIYPTYVVVLLLTLAASVLLYIVTGNYLPFYITGGINSFMDSQSYLGWWPVLIFILMNIFIFGQDVTMFLGVRRPEGSLYFTADWSAQDVRPLQFLLVPQAWSLAIELMFYFIAPFIVRFKIWLLSVLMVASIGGAYILIAFGLREDPWSYRFFPTQIGFFVLGILAYKAYVYLKTRPLSVWVTGGVSLVMVFFTGAYQYIPIPEEYKKLAYYVALACSLPFMFLWSKDIKLDRVVG